MAQVIERSPCASEGSDCLVHHSRADGTAVVLAVAAIPPADRVRRLAHLVQIHLLRVDAPEIDTQADKRAAGSCQDTLSGLTSVIQPGLAAGCAYKSL